MTILPIVERELRVAARARSTPWSRTIAALAAVLVAAGFITIAEMGNAFGGLGTIGSQLFSSLSILAFFGAWLAGLFFTSDAISEEKREGTFGLLFLTDLRGYDVILGKLLSTSLRAVYALLAIMPVLATTLLMGGVTGAHFARACIALLCAMSLSLSIGLFISTISSEPQRSLAATLLLLLAIAALGPGIDSLYARIEGFPFHPALSLTSPAFMLLQAYGGPKFWHSFLASSAMFAVFIAASSFLSARTWQQSPRRFAPERSLRTRARRSNRSSAHPLFRLISEQRLEAVVVWVMVAVSVAGTLFFALEGAFAVGAWELFGSLILFIVYLGIALHACRLFVELRKSGMLELVLTTPLTAAEILRSYWSASLSRFFLPVMLIVLIHGASAGATQWHFAEALGSGVSSIQTEDQLLVRKAFAAVAGGVAAAATIITSLLALGWFGLWAGITTNGTNVATLKTFAFVEIIPWFAITMLTTVAFLAVMGAGVINAQFWPFFSIGLSAVLYIVKNLFFIWWARNKVRRELRTRAAVPAGTRIKRSSESASPASGSSTPALT